ncbi:hypothetical protein [Rugamonas rubra]|uniref:Uncharacterized protein n=1 Tax=Rugamonas rubra TaxID=758825 RepID=A0A1I4M4A9_9BURK|nr:hypothetical protein [Rugamonas rubra]SFL98062.1 hypothetical protein SAMN02982985_02234 [Rugamonas rubra]
MTSVRTVTYTATVTVEEDEGAGGPDCQHHKQRCADDEDGDNGPPRRGERRPRGGDDAIDDLPLPNRVKRALREWLGEERGQHHKRERLPSAASAGATIRDFQKSALGGANLSSKQMDQMARTGYLTKNDGSTVAVPAEVRQAAKRYMAEGGKMFKQLESASDGKHDGQLGTGDYDNALKDGTLAPRDRRSEVVGSCHEYALPPAGRAAETINRFQHDKLGGAMLSSEQMDQMARTGYLKKDGGATIAVPPEVQDAAKRFMAHDGRLFKSVESASNGKHDGMLGTGDYYQALKHGKLSQHGGRCDGGVGRGDQLLPSSPHAARTIHDFQDEQLKGANLSAEQMDQMARTGYLTKNDGGTVAVPAEVQDAAKRFMAHDGKLFKQLEAASDGRHDGQLGTGDYDNALKDGMLSRHRHEPDVVLHHGEYQLPSGGAAAHTIRDFQQEELKGANLSVEQMDQMARTGYLKKNDGSTVTVPAEVQAAAQRMMADGGALFKQLEAATDGQHDGQLGTGDYDHALKDGMLSAKGGDAETFCRPRDYRLPSAANAAHAVRDFQNQQGVALMSSEQMDQMARTGYLTKDDGSTVAVPPEMQAAAQRMMADDAALFKQLESASDGKHDGRLGTGDYDNALKDGMLSAPSEESEGYQRPDEDHLPGRSRSALAISEFQDRTLGGAMLSSEQMDQMARTGYLTKDGGGTIAVPPEVQDAARRYMANGAELFKEIEASQTGSHDGLLAISDYRQALKDGTVYELS